MLVEIQAPRMEPEEDLSQLGREESPSFHLGLFDPPQWRFGCLTAAAQGEAQAPPSASAAMSQGGGHSFPVISGSSRAVIV